MTVICAPTGCAASSTIWLPGSPEALLRELRAYNDAYERAVRAEGL